MLEQIKVIIADDNDEIRNYFSKIFWREEDIKVVGTARNGSEAVKLAKEKNPDIIIMDIEMDYPTDGINAIQQISKMNPRIKSIVLTIHKEDEFLFQAYAAGAVDYLVKTTSVTTILNSVRSVYKNQLSIRPGVAELILEEFSRLFKERKSLLRAINIVSKLTNAEVEIIKAVYQGETYSDISKKRHVERGTIKSQVNKILKKFHCNRMSEVIDIFSELGILEQLEIFDS
jgi:DNA-binding NarL/FixJ family response regulator